MEEVECPDCPAGIPAWVMTFADLMSLLMCFFVLLLSFSEMDALKFKRLAGSMSEAFGVQNRLDVTEIPRGTSIIAQEFSPAIPQPTPINEIYQSTRELTEDSLDFDESEQFDVEQGTEGQTQGVQLPIVEQLEALIEETRSDAAELAEGLQPQIIRGEMEVETQGRKIIVRIKEQGSFRPGSADLAPNYYPILGRVREVIAKREGVVSVEGHTDNSAMGNARFRSNWDLSALRAVSVAQELFVDNVLDPRRFAVAGFSDTRPLVENNSEANRARNRRVEIIIRQSLDPDLQEQIEALRSADGELFRSFNLEEGEQLYALPPRNIF
ncbi:MAG: flagellar motor protein MotB [Pseudohongiella sp.]|nr:MAG: flagellar motor protein MotB [Pseudohongiella sp.]